MAVLLSKSGIVLLAVIFTVCIYHVWLVPPLIVSDAFASTEDPWAGGAYAVEGRRQGNRNPSDPFVTGDGFRSTCRLVFDDVLKLEEEEFFLRELLRVASGMRADEQLQQEALNVPVVTVFVQTHLMNRFIECCLKHITRVDIDWQLLLVSHNSDASAPFNMKNIRNKGENHSYEHQLEWVLDNPRVKAWYATNTAILHPKLWPIPIGIENRYVSYGRHVDVYREEFLRVHTTSASTRRSDKKLLLIAFGLSSYPQYRSKVRRIVEKAFAANAEDVTINHHLPRQGKITASIVRSYLHKLSLHHFVLAPRGNGMDTHRLWEALYMGCVPIVQRSTMDARLLSKLPVLLVDSFADVTPELLSLPRVAKLKDLVRVAVTSDGLLSMAYWRRVIANEQNMH